MSYVRSRQLAATLAWAGVCLWILVAPFEASQPLLHLPGQSLSTVEAALVAVFVVFGIAALLSSITLKTPLTLPWIAFIATTGIAALAASSERTNALHMAGRFALSFGVFIVTVNGITTRSRVVSTFAAAALAGFVISVIAALEFAGVPAVMKALTVFRSGPAVVGAQVRAAGPLQYPTIASMYLEILFAFVVALVAMAFDEGRNAAGIVGVVLLALMSEAVILTFTRSGIITMACTLAIVGAWRLRGQRIDAGSKAVIVVAIILGVELLTSRSIDAMRLRMTTEGQEHWYQASIDAPPELAFATGSTTTVAVTVTNVGRTTWDSTAEHPYRFAYHWLLPDQDRAENYEGLRTAFDKPVAPDDTVTVFARVRAPGRPGTYRLMWDVVQEGQLWFSTEPDAEFVFTRAIVSGPATGAAGASMPVALPKIRPRPGRLRLWSAAVRMFADHPLLGVGPDNFRLLYGPYAHLDNADPRVHSNNMYLEVLVGGGLLTAAAFFWLFARACMRAARLVRLASRGPMAMPAAGIASACAAIAIHGLSDSFLSFTATYVLMAITLGLAVAADRLAATYAHRV